MPPSLSQAQFKQLMDHLITRRDLLRVGGKSVVIASLGMSLGACQSSGSSGGAKSSAKTIDSVPAASADYTTLKRTTFGVTRAEMTSIAEVGRSVWLEQQLDYITIDDGTLEADIAALFPLTLQSPGDLFAGFPDNIAEVALQMISAAQYRQLYSKRQLYEIMVEFWSDHFNIHLLNGLGPTMKPRDDQTVIRAHALGNFGDLLRASARSPAMLFYLDNFFNVASGPNENYARELMELHTLGVDGGYTEADIKAVARCFTGWTLDFAPGSGFGTFAFVNAVHDQDIKLVLGNTIPANGGQDDGEQVLNILINHPSTAQFIATKLCRRFISDDPPSACIDEVAQAFTASNGDIKTTLRAVFACSEFLTLADSKFIRPSEYLGQIYRALAPDQYPSDNGQLFYFVQALLGQLPFYWPTPDGYPDQQSYWASTGGMLNRWRLSFLSLAPLPSLEDIRVVDMDYSALLQGANTLNQIVPALEQNMLMRDLSSRDRGHIIDGLSENLSIDQAFQLSATEARDVGAIVAAILISSAYFQLR